MSIIRPRLNDFHELTFTQEEVSFAIPFIDEDIPLYLDPFLLWKSPSQNDTALHGSIINSFNYLGMLYATDERAAIDILVELSECDEVGLGNSKTKVGKKIGDTLAREVLQTFQDIPQLTSNGYTHLEEVQLLVEGFSRDRISDIAANLIKSYLIDYTIHQAAEYGIPASAVDVTYFSERKHEFTTESLELPVHPTSGAPILLVPKRWLRFTPWLNLDDYFTNYIATSEKILRGEAIPRVQVLDYNRKNFDAVQAYVKTKQRQVDACKNDPLFAQIPVTSTTRKLATIKKLPTGKTGNADKIFENTLVPMLASMLYPELDFAKEQVRTVSGAQIRDLIFYNNTSHPFLKGIFETYKCKQIVVEMKNVKEVKSEHVNQLNRYLTEQFGQFGILFARNKPPKPVIQNTIDLWAGQRRCILIMTDEDLVLMCELYKNKQRRPIDVIKKKYVDFIRMCPA